MCYENQSECCKRRGIISRFHEWRLRNWADSVSRSNERLINEPRIPTEILSFADSSKVAAGTSASRAPRIVNRETQAAPCWPIDVFQYLLENVSIKLSSHTWRNGINSWTKKYQKKYSRFFILLKITEITHFNDHPPRIKCWKYPVFQLNQN